MKPAPFEYHAPRSLDEALELLARHGEDAKPLAGGQSLIPAMNFRLAAPAVLVDLNHLETLAHVSSGGGELRVGAMTRHATLERSDAIAREAPLVAAAMPFVAHAAIRTRGTIGGSLAHADPAAELPAVMLALDARFIAQGPNGSREIVAGDFFTGLFSTALAPGELLTGIVIRRRAPRSGDAFEEISRRHGDFALAGVAAAITLDERGQCRDARIAVLSLADRPLRAASAERALLGETPSDAAIRAAAEAAAAHDIDPSDDIHASREYRRQLARVLVRRALTRAVQSVES